MSTMIATDVVDRILGFLRTDHITLKTCSTVFPQLVDRHLYSHITLRTPIMEDHTEPDEDVYYAVQFPDFLRQLAQRPQIVFCILGVRVIIAVMPPPHDDVTLTFLPVISSLMPMFRKLQSIELRTWGTFSWNALGPGFFTAFQQCLRFPSINQVTISNINGFPLDSFDDCKNLRNLVLSGQFTDGEGVFTSSYPHLSSLRIESQHSVESQPASDLTRIVSWMKSSALQTLSLPIRQSTDFQPLIGACFVALVTLDLDLSRCSKIDLPDGTIYSQFPALKYLVLHCIIVSSESPFSFLPDCTPFLIALSRNSSPHSVHLSVHLRFLLLPLVSRGNSPDINWPDVTFLDGLSVFRQPIELRLVGPRFAMPRFGYLFEQSSEVQRLLAGGKLTLIDDSE